MLAAVRPFKVAVPDTEIRALKERLASTIYPDILEDIKPWEDGTDLAYFKVRVLNLNQICLVE